MELSEAARQARREYRKRYNANLSEEAKKKQREYLRAWKQRNPDKVKQYEINFWESQISPLTRAMLRSQHDVEDMPESPEASIENKVIEMRQQGYSLREIGDRFNISHMKVSRILKDHNNL